VLTFLPTITGFQVALDPRFSFFPSGIYGE